MRIVSIAPFMPFPGIAHAGGEFYRRHAELTASSHQLLVICPRDAENESALARDPDPPYGRQLIAPRLRRPGRTVNGILSRTVPFLAGRPFLRALLEDEHAKSALGNADRIELQWFNAVALAPMLRRRFPGTPIVGVFHDVVSQAHWRMVRTRGVSLRWRLRALAQLLCAVPLEWRAMSVLDTAVVLSEKDRSLLKLRGGNARIVVMSPPLDQDGMPTHPLPEPSGPPDVLFVGALWRVENDDAAHWLLREIWPLVLGAVPDARLTIAGARPGRELEQEARRLPNVELTGYVGSLSPFYQRASVVVAPMRLGAGVKLKSVIAMLWGLPVVATRVAAEGVGELDVFSAVADSAPCFARSVVRVLIDPTSFRDVRERAHRWAHEMYSTERYIRSLDQLYH